jgi:hypothetical protein
LLQQPGIISSNNNNNNRRNLCPRCSIGLRCVRLIVPRQIDDVLHSAYDVLPSQLTEIKRTGKYFGKIGPSWSEPALLKSTFGGGKSGYRKGGIVDTRVVAAEMAAPFCSGCGILLSTTTTHFRLLVGQPIPAAPHLSDVYNHPLRRAIGPPVDRDSIFSGMACGDRHTFNGMACGDRHELCCHTASLLNRLC